MRAGSKKKVESPSEKVAPHRARKAPAGIPESAPNPDAGEAGVAPPEPAAPKDGLFLKIIEVLIEEMEPTRRSIRILEPGVGPASFTRFVLRQAFLDRFPEVYVEGADLAPGMPVRATEVIKSRYQSCPHGQRVTIVLSSGVNCIDAADPFYDEMKSRGRLFDAIVASRFEHYCPNSHQSALAGKYRESRIPFSTKAELRRLCYGLLNRGGIYFAINGWLDDLPEEHGQSSPARERQGAYPGTHDAGLPPLQELSPSVVRSLRCCGAQPPRQIPGNGPAPARERAGATAGAEIEPLSAATRDLARLFGEENVYCMIHPSLETHPGFYLMWAVKRN